MTQSPRFGGGAAAQTDSFAAAAEALGRRVQIVHPPFLPVADSLNQLAQAPRIARRVAGAREVWVVAAAASYGYGAVRSDRPYDAWIGTALEDEWAARRPSLPLARRLALDLNGPLLRRLERAVLRGARRVFATSPSSRAALGAAAGVDTGRIGILPIPVDLVRFAPLPEDEWLAGLERPRVVFVGRADDPRKNAGLLLEAFAVLRRRLPEARLRLVGRPPAQSLPPGATAVGEVPCVAEHLRDAALFVLPSLQEGFGIVAAEALASGVPVVTTPCGGPEALVRDSGGGHVLDGFDATELAATLEGLLGARGALAEMRRSGRAYVEREHAPERLRGALAAALGGDEDG